MNSPKPMLYALVLDDGRFICRMEEKENNIETYGACTNYHGNYYKEIIVGQKPLIVWLDWFINDAIPNKYVAISQYDDFYFEPDDVKVVCLTLKQE